MSQKAVMWVTRASVDRYDPGLDFYGGFSCRWIPRCSSHEQNEAPSTISLRVKFWQLSSEPKSGAEACRATPPIVPVARWKVLSAWDCGLPTDIAQNLRVVDIPSHSGWS